MSFAVSWYCVFKLTDNAGDSAIQQGNEMKYYLSIGLL